MKRRKMIAGTGMATLLVTLAVLHYIDAWNVLSADFLQSVEAQSEPGSASTVMPVTEVAIADDVMDFEATAYCDFGVTYSGVWVQRGIVAADPEILPIGSVIEVEAGDYSGIYTVMDTGGVVRGRMIDIFIPDYDEAVQFGRQTVKVRVLRKGWQPDVIDERGLAVAG